LDADKDIGCLVLTGSTKAFAAGADISEMKERTFDYAYQTVRPFQAFITVSVHFLILVAVTVTVTLAF
jgi:enoyl-CoA hydratase/carnithine racemase